MRGLFIRDTGGVVMRRAILGLLAVPIVFSSLAVPAQAFEWFEFMKSVGCQKLPMLSCELLDATNARNIALTYRGLLSQRFCGTINVGEAKQLVEIGAASPECEAVIGDLYKDTQRFIKNGDPGGVSVDVNPSGTVGDLTDIKKQVIDLK